MIVAAADADLPALQHLYERGIANGVNCTLIDRARLAELEPHAAGVTTPRLTPHLFPDFSRAGCTQI